MRKKAANKNAAEASHTSPAPKEIPPGATRKAVDRPLNRGGGAPGSGGGPRHAAGDAGSESESLGRTETMPTSATSEADYEDALEQGPSFSGRSGGAAGGTPARNLRSLNPHGIEDNPARESYEEETTPVRPSGPSVMRLTGFEAIEFAEKQGLLLNKHPDSICGPRMGLNVAEAEALAEDDADLIWLDVRAEDYYSGVPSDYEPER